MRKKAIKILLVCFCVLAVSEGFLLYFAYNQYTNIRKHPIDVLKQSHTQVAAENQTAASAAAGIAPTPQAELKHITVDGKEYTENPNVVSMLFCGFDYMSSRASRNLGERSDTIMVCSIDAVNNKATLISIPRDTRALVTKVDANTGKVTDKEYNKINAAFSYGGGTDKYSYQNTQRCVSKFFSMDGTFDIPIDYYVGLNVDGIPHIASAIGGVTLKLEEDFPGIGSKGSTVTLSGDKAVTFVRERHAFASADLARVDHQQQFMIALAKKIQKMGAAQSIIKLYDKVTSYVSTNLNTDEMLALASILDKVKINDIDHQTIPGTWKSPFIWPDTKALKSLILKTYYTPST